MECVELTQFAGPAVGPDFATLATTLRHHVEVEAPNMVLASTYVPPDGAVACYLLQRVLSRGGATGKRWHSVFVNSGTEAIATAVKYSRNAHNRSGRGGICQVLVLDATDTVRFAFGHEVPGLRDQRDDGVTICSTVADFEHELREKAWQAVVVVTDRLSEAGRRDVASLVPRDAAPDAVVVWGSLTDAAALDRIEEIPANADLFFLGEACVGRQMPCGIVSFTRKSFELWNNPTDCVAHVSTFGGNAIALALLCDELAAHASFGEHDKSAIARMRRSHLVRRARLRMHGNTWQTRIIDLAGINLCFDSAKDVVYRIGQRKYVDAASGGGPAFRGHNRTSPSDIDDRSVDGIETDRLERRLGELTELPILLPAVSGATAVDIAILTALYARPGRSVIVTLVGNYSGKGVLSLTVSRTSCHFRDLDANAFFPSLPDIVEVSMDDLDEVEATLRRTDIAMVWLEPVQGLDCIAVPDAVFELVQRHRATSGYLVGFDEVLTAFWRDTGATFLASGAMPCAPDMCALSKALSDALLPLGAVMTSVQTFRDVEEASSQGAYWLRHHYRNDFASMLALVALAEAEPALKSRGAVEAGLVHVLDAATRSEVFSEYRRKGLHSRLVLSQDFAGVKKWPEMIESYEAVVSRIIAQRCGVITLQLRLLPAVASADPDELAAALRRTGEVLSGLTRGAVYRTMTATVVAGLFRELSTAAIALAEHISDSYHERSSR